MANSSYTGIDEYLFQKRTQLGLSQDGLVQALQQFSPLFNEIDVLTVSRWERGKVSPNIRRQVALMAFLAMNHISCSRTQSLILNSYRL